MCLGAGPAAGDALDFRDQCCAMLLASSSRRGTTSCSAGSSRTARAVCPVNRHSTDIDMLVRSFDQIVSLIRVTGGDSIDAPSSVLRSCAMRSLCAVVAFADQKPVALRRQVFDHAGLDHLVRRKDHAADDPPLRDRGAQAAAGIEKGKVGRRRMIGRQPDIVPPGNAVLREDDRGVLAQQRPKAVRKAGHPGCFQRADDEVLRAERRRIVGGLDLRRELGCRRREASGLLPSPPLDAARASRRRRRVRRAQAAPQNGCRRRPRRKCRYAWGWCSFCEGNAGNLVSQACSSAQRACGHWRRERWSMPDAFGPIEAERRLSLLTRFLPTGHVER